jgi:hypothetical protein
MAFSNCRGAKKKLEVAYLHKFHKLNVTTKKDLYPLLFIDEIFNIIARHETYVFLDGYSRYH